MAYQTHETLPKWVQAEWSSDGSATPLNWSPERVLWAGQENRGTLTPPAIGTKIIVTMNSIGPGTVRGYFTEDGYLGLLVELHKPPKWWIEQNPSRPLGHIFGPEFKLP